MANFVDSGYFRQRMTANMRDLGEIFERTYPKRLDFPEMSAIMYMDKYVLQGRGCSVMHPQSAVIFMEEDILSDTHKPLMLEEFLTVPILERMARKLCSGSLLSARRNSRRLRAFVFQRRQR